MNLRQLSQLADQFRRYNDHHAFERLFSALSKQVWALIHSKVPESETENVFQEVCLAVAKQLAKKKADHIPALVYRVTQRKIADYFRSQNPIWQNAKPMDDRILNQSDPADQTANRDLRLDALRFLQRSGLSEAQVESLVLHYWLGHTIAETGAILGQPANTVKRRIYFAMRKLRQFMAEEEQVAQPTQ